RRAPDRHSAVPGAAGPADDAPASTARPACRRGRVLDAPGAPGPYGSLRHGTASPPAPRGSPRRLRHRCATSGAHAWLRPVAQRAPAPSSGTPPSATPGRRHRSWSADSGDPSRSSRCLSSPLLLPLVREPPFFDEVLGQLQPHYQFADLGADQRELAFLGIAPGLEPPRPLLRGHSLPGLKLMG